MQVSAQPVRSSRGMQYKWIVATVVILGVFMSILDQTIVNIAIPCLQTAFVADIHSVQWVLTAYILTQGVVTPTAAYFSDTFGIKRFYIFCLAAFIISSALCGIAWSLPVLILFRILQGAGGAALFPLSITLLFREFPPQERGAAMGFFGVPALLAPALGPTLGGYIVTFAGWPLIFYINVPIGIVAIILAMVLLREYRPEGRTRFDFLGFLLVGVIFLSLFVTAEIIIANRGGQPLLDLRLFANGPFRTGIIASVFVIFCLFSGLFIFTIYLQTIRGLSAFQAGLILLPQALASMVSVIIGGRLVDRIGVRAVMIPGLLILALATWQLTLVTTYSPYWWIQIMFILRGLALGLTIQPLTVAMLAEVRPQQLAQASSLNTVGRAVSSSLGIAIIATLVQTQTAIHFGHLAEQVTTSSPIGQLLPKLEAYFVAHGASMQAARTTALQVIAGLLQSQSFVLALHDALFLTLFVIALAIIATLFVRASRRPARIQEPSLSPVVPGETQESEASLAEAILAG